MNNPLKKKKREGWKRKDGTKMKMSAETKRNPMEEKRIAALETPGVTQNIWTHQGAGLHTAHWMV